MFLRAALVAIAWISITIQAAPTSAAAPIPNDPPYTPLAFTAYPKPLPSNFPKPTSTGSPAAVPVPTHFAVFGYSYDGRIFNESYYLPEEPPYNQATTAMLQVPGHVTYPPTNKVVTYGSYTFGLGPHQYVFAHLSGKVWTYPGSQPGHVRPHQDVLAFDEIYISYGQSTGTDYVPGSKDVTEDQVPTCQVIPGFNALYCEKNGKFLPFQRCKKEDAYKVSWGSDPEGQCDEVVLHAVEVPHGYGDEVPENGCWETSGPGCPGVD